MERSINLSRCAKCWKLFGFSFTRITANRFLKRLGEKHSGPTNRPTPPTQELKRAATINGIDVSDDRLCLNWGRWIKREQPTWVDKGWARDSRGKNYRMTVVTSMAKSLVGHLHVLAQSEVSDSPTSRSFSPQSMEEDDLDGQGELESLETGFDNNGAPYRPNK